MESSNSQMLRRLSRPDSRLSNADNSLFDSERQGEQGGEARPVKSTTQEPSYPAVASFLFKFTKILENDTSTARDHLANERTVLAWVRTAAIFATSSVGYLQFYLVDKASSNIESREASKFHTLVGKFTRVLCLMSIVISILTLLFGTIRYFKTQSLLIQNYFPITRVSILVIILINMSMLLSMLVLNIEII